MQLLRIETLYHLLRYNLKQIKKLKYKILKIIQDVATTLVVLWGGGEEKIEKSCKKGSLCKYECVSTVINVQIPPQTVSATLYLEPEYKSFFFFFLINISSYYFSRSYNTSIKSLQEN